MTEKKRETKVGKIFSEEIHMANSFSPTKDWKPITGSVLMFLIFISLFGSLVSDLF